MGLFYSLVAGLSLAHSVEDALVHGVVGVVVVGVFAHEVFELAFALAVHLAASLSVELGQTALVHHVVAGGDVVVSLVNVLVFVLEEGQGSVVLLHESVVRLEFLLVFPGFLVFSPQIGFG